MTGTPCDAPSPPCPTTTFSQPILGTCWTCEQRRSRGSSILRWCNLAWWHVQQSIPDNAARSVSTPSWTSRDSSWRSRGTNGKMLLQTV